jgi:hypothetical protein
MPSIHGGEPGQHWAIELPCLGPAYRPLRRGTVADGPLRERNTDLGARRTGRVLESKHHHASTLGDRFVQRTRSAAGHERRRPLLGGSALQRRHRARHRPLWRSAPAPASPAFVASSSFDALSAWLGRDELRPGRAAVLLLRQRSCGPGGAADSGRLRSAPARRLGDPERVGCCDGPQDVVLAKPWICVRQVLGPRQWALAVSEVRLSPHGWVQFGLPASGKPPKGWIHEPTNIIAIEPGGAVALQTGPVLIGRAA